MLRYYSQQSIIINTKKPIISTTNIFKKNDSNIGGILINRSRLLSSSLSSSSCCHQQHYSNTTKKNNNSSSFTTYQQYSNRLLYTTQSNFINRIQKCLYHTKKSSSSSQKDIESLNNDLFSGDFVKFKNIKTTKEKGQGQGQGQGQGRTKNKKINRKQSNSDIQTNKKQDEPIKESSAYASTDTDVRSFNEIVQSMQTRRNKYLEAVSISDSQQFKKWKYADTEGRTDQQTYLDNIAEGDLIETHGGDVGVIIQVPDDAEIFKYAIMDHQGSVSYFPSSSGFAFKIPNFVEPYRSEGDGNDKIKTNSIKSDQNTTTTVTSLSECIRVIDDDPLHPVVTVVKGLRDELCPSIKRFIQNSQKISQIVKGELENMFLELQDSSDPLNMSLFEIAYIVEQNVVKKYAEKKKLSSILQELEPELEKELEKEQEQKLEDQSELKENNQNTKSSSNPKKYDVLRANFPPHGFEGTRRRVDNILLYTIYTIINTSFNTKVLFNGNDRFTPNTITLLPFSEENAQARAIDAMHILISKTARQTSVDSENGNSRYSMNYSSYNNNNNYNNNNRGSSTIPKLIRDLVTAENNPDYLKNIIGTNHTNNNNEKLLSSSSFSNTKKQPNGNHEIINESNNNFYKENSEILNVIKRFAGGDISPNDLITHSTVILFLKQLDYFRALAGNIPSKTMEITETYALEFLQKIGVLSSKQNPFRLQSKMRSIEVGSARIQNEHFFPERPSPLFDRVANLREELDKNMTVYCIDSADAHEIDDGVSVSNTDDRIWKVYIHIADPASALLIGNDGTSDSLLKHAYRQTSTAYYPEAVIPMFPKWLSNRLGLVQDDNSDSSSSYRRCLSFVIDFDSQTDTFDIENAKVIPTVTRSIRQITYDEVNKILLQKPSSSSSQDKTGKDLRNLLRVATAFSKSRFTEGGAISLQLSSPIVKIQDKYNDKDGISNNNNSGFDVIIKNQKRTVANELVAELMILCNHATAVYMSNRGIPGMYRTHDIQLGTQAAEDQFMSIVEPLTKNFDWNKKPWDINNNNNVNGIDMGMGIGPALSLRDSILLLRRIKPTVIGVQERPHRALGVSKYMSATSPLRRFQDVLCHWQLESYLLLNNNRNFQDKTTSTYMFDYSQMDTMSIRLMRTQSLLRKASQQSQLFWMLRDLEKNINLEQNQQKQHNQLGKQSKELSSNQTYCLITSKPFFGTQQGFSEKYGMFVTIDLDTTTTTSLRNNSQQNSKRKLLYEIGDSILCQIINIDYANLNVKVRPI